MPDLYGAILPGVLSLFLITAGFAKTSLNWRQSAAAFFLALVITATFSRWHVDAERIALFLVPGSTVVLLYLLRKGHYISPGYAFAVTYWSTLPVDIVYAAEFIGSLAAALPGIGGAGILDGLVMISALTALAVYYGNWRRAGNNPLSWFSAGKQAS